MDSNNMSNKTTAPNGSAENMASHVGTAVSNVYDATKMAGKAVNVVAREELAQLRADLDDLTSRLPSLSDIDLNAAKDKLAAKIAAAKNASMDAAASARQQFTHGVEVTGDYVKERPLQSVSVAAAFGLLIGLLIARR